MDTAESIPLYFMTMQHRAQVACFIGTPLKNGVNAEVSDTTSVMPSSSHSSHSW